MKKANFYQQFGEFGVEFRQVGHGLSRRHRLQVEHPILVDHAVSDLRRLVFLLNSSIHSH